MTDRKTFVLYTDLSHDIEACSDQEAGQILKAIYRYVGNGTRTQSNDRFIQSLLDRIISAIETNDRRYQETCLANRITQIKRWGKKKGLSESEIENQIRTAHDEYNVPYDGIRPYTTVNEPIRSDTTRYVNDTDIDIENEIENEIEIESDAKPARTERTEPERNSFYDPEDPDLPFR